MSGLIRQMASERYLLRIVVVAAIGGFLFGYDERDRNFKQIQQPFRVGADQ
jgi:hypothetical protein